MLRDSIRAALAAAVLWPIFTRPAPPSPVQAWQPSPVQAWQPSPVQAWQPSPGPVRRVAGAALDAADRVAARWLPPL